MKKIYIITLFLISGSVFAHSPLHNDFESMMKRMFNHMEMMNMTPLIRRFTIRSIDKVEANRISNKLSNIRGSRYTSNNSSKPRGDTCNSRIELKGTEVNTQTSKLIA